MPSSAINVDPMPICTGCAVALDGDTVRLAVPGKATHIATAGAVQRGVVAIEHLGIVDLNDWRMSTGSSLLSIGSTYYVTTGGKLTTTTTSQPIGVAVSQQQLLLRFSEPTTSVTPTPTPTPSPSSGTTLLVGSSDPAPGAGKDGDFFLNTTTKKLFGPKGMGGWPAGIQIGSVMGEKQLTVSVLNGSVTGLAFQPTFVVVSIRKPADGLNIFATVAALNSDGFDYELSGAPDSGDYFLAYTLQ